MNKLQFITSCKITIELSFRYGNTDSKSLLWALLVWRASTKTISKLLLKYFLVIAGISFGDSFLIAYLYETELGDNEMAEKFYKGVIDLHPESNEAKLAALSLKHLGTSPEDLVRQFQKNNSDLEK